MAAYRKTKGELISSQAGGASIISLVTVLGAFLLAATYLYLAQAELRMTTRNIQGRQALYLAEAGVELTRAELAANVLWQPQPSYTLSTGTFTVSIRQAAQGYTIESKGNAGSAVRKILVNISQDVNGGWKIISYQEIFN